MEGTQTAAAVASAGERPLERAQPNLWVMRRQLAWADRDRVWAVAWSRDLSYEQLLAAYPRLWRPHRSIGRAAPDARCHRAELLYDGHVVWSCELGDDDHAAHVFAPHWGGHLDPARFTFRHRRSPAVAELRPAIVRAAVRIDGRPESSIERQAVTAFGLGARVEGSPALELVALRHALLAASMQKRAR